MIIRKIHISLDFGDTFGDEQLLVCCFALSVGISPKYCNNKVDCVDFGFLCFPFNLTYLFQPNYFCWVFEDALLVV